ncbi:MFS transporter [Tianweitania populi]|uniref:MFS transporter n=1 Tax=Tianweitania populi TaxID=1607949 RepID=UPI001672EE51|nr:MFS transporter [Tianweitania populi]
MATAVKSLSSGLKHLRFGVQVRFIIAALSVLVLAQLLNGVLTTSAIRKTAFEASATAARIVGNDWAFRIQNSLRFGKPITQMFGLTEMLADIRGDLPFLSGVVVTLTDGSIVESNIEGQLDPGAGMAIGQIAAKAANGGTPPTLSAVQLGANHLFVLPVRGARDVLAGTLTMVVPEAVIAEAARGPISLAVQSICVTSIFGALAIALGSLMIRANAAERTERWKLLVIPALVLVSAQCISSWHNVTTFRDVYLRAATTNVERAVERFQTDLQRLVEQGVHLERLSDYEAPFKRMASNIPELAVVRLTAMSGETLSAYDAGRGGPTLDDTGTAFQSVVREIRYSNDGDVLARLTATLSQKAISEGVRRRVLDASTVLLTSALFGFELLVLFGILMRRLVQQQHQRVTDQDSHHLLARPASFLLVFGWGLTLSFVPLQMSALTDEPLLGLSRDVTMALPISTEMGCALVTALLAGILTDRKGWHIPFLLGSVICAAGALFSALATMPVLFLASRGLVGLGYGLAWMGIQGYIFTWSSPRTRTQGIANLVAGIFAGQICGNVTGAMLADQLGFSAVFQVAAFAGLLPIPFAWFFMRSYFGRPHEMRENASARQAASAPVPIPLTAQPGSRLSSLLTDRNFLALLLLSVVPFSIAQVGLLYYTLPVYLSHEGFEQADIGRIMMIYGLSVIYIAPVLGGWVDRHIRKKPFIVLGGLLGGAGLVFTYVDIGVATLVSSVFLLGLASSLGGPAQSSFALHLPSVQRLGTGRAMGIQRAADKLGQMIGPVAVGALFALIGAREGIALTGVYLVASNSLFFLIARDRLPPAHTAVDQPHA